jgi:predicted CXXCH cytochrome family protein
VRRLFPFLLILTIPAQAYTGSKACQSCHAAIYARWQNTRMANVIQDPKLNPKAILGDFDHPNPLVKFTKADVAFTYGSKWKQRYFTKRGDDYYVFPAQWDIRNATWRPYNPQAGTDWWIPLYPNDPMQRPTGPLCDGCHSVNYNPATKQVTEWNVGCEKCHGPGDQHVNRPSKTNIVNPAALDSVRASDICLQCHSQGRPITNPIEGRQYDWPVGFLPGNHLSDVWTLEEHKLGETTFTHFPDGSAHKNRMQGNDFVTSRMHARGITCASCHDVHGTGNNADLIKPGNAMCLECHGPQSPNGPRGSLEEHTHHTAASKGSECVACHMPAIAQTIANVNVRSHTFRFITPTLSEQFKIPNACTTCHNRRTNAWATKQLQSWANFSEWRVAQ